MLQHRTARKIASAWHGGQWTGLYALCSSGAIVTTFYVHPVDCDCDQHPLAIAEIQGCLEWTAKHPNAGPPNNAKRDTDDLTRLLAYVQHYGPRDAVPGWSAMPW